MNLHAQTNAPTYRPLVTACAEHGISRSVAFELARTGLLKTFALGQRRYVYLESLRTLPERLPPEWQSKVERLKARNPDAPLGGDE